jgi:hypothetical protein
MSDRRVFRWATTSARVLVGTVVAAASVVGVVTAISIPWPTLAREPVSIEATPAPAASTVSCDGGLLVQARDLDAAGAIEVAAVQTVTSGVLPGSPEPATAQLGAPDVASGLGPLAFTAEPGPTGRTDLAASGSAVAAFDDLAGFAASVCRPPLMESWLVAGSGATGAADFVLLTNPGTVAATVQLTVYGASGPQVPPGGSELVVAAGSQRVVSIAGLARGEESPVIRINSRGAPVQAAVQSSIARVLEPGGVDQASAVVAPEVTQRILGIVVGDDDDASDGSPTLIRLLSANADAQATVTVREVAESDDAAAPLTVPLVAGVPTELALEELDPGVYSVDITATEPVVAAAWHTTGFGAGADFAWHTPSPEVGLPTLFAVPGGPAATMTVQNSGDVEATVTVSRRDGSAIVEVTLLPGESTSFSLPRREVYLLDGRGAQLRAAVTMAGSDQLAAFSVWPADAAAPAVTVYP